MNWIQKFWKINEKQLCLLFKGVCSFLGAAISAFYSFVTENA